MTAAAARRPASPYARRLARERGVELALITGSGPGGRIVAADLEALLREPPAEPSRAPAAALATISAYIAVLDLGPLQQLLGNLAAARTAVSLDDMLVRAAAVALEAVPVLGRDGMITLGLETGSGPGARLAVVADAHLGLANSAAFAACGIGPDTPDPPFGRFDRVPGSGEFTGLVRETAAHVFLDRIHATDTEEEIARGMERVFDHALELGITSLYNSLTPCRAIRAYQDIFHYQVWPDWPIWALATVYGVGMFVCGLSVFVTYEDTLAEQV